MSTKNALIIIGIIVVLAVGLFFYMKQVSSPAATVDTQSAVMPTDTTTSSSVTNGDVTNSLATSHSEKKMYTQAILKTNLGSIIISLDTTNTPKTVENFTKLASEGFYNGTKFHRVIKDFMIQGGDPLSKDDSKQAMWGTGGPGYQFDDEIKDTNNDVKGTIAMANAGPNTNGSQFFINVADNIFLNGKHTVFGHVTSGYDLVEKISKVATGPNDRPIEAVVIESIELK